MNLIVLHDEALRANHPAFAAAPKDTKAIYIWDDEYLKIAQFSLKRLVFIYECVRELPLEIVYGDTAAIVQQFNADTLYIPETNNPLILKIIDELRKIANVQIIQDEAFARVGEGYNFKRFSQYWKKAEKTAFLMNGGQ